MEYTPFSLNVDFTGICCLFPNAPWHLSPDEFCVAMANAFDPLPRGELIDLKALDKRPLSRHYPILQIPTELFPDFQIPAQKTRFKAMTTWPLIHHQVSLIPEFSVDSPTTGLAYSQETDPQKWDKSNLINWIPNFNEIIDWNFDLSHCYSKTPPMRIGGQVFLNQGSLQVTKLRNRKWLIRDTLSRNEIKRKLAHKFRFRFEDLKSLRIVLTQIPGRFFGRDIKPPIEIQLGPYLKRKSRTITILNIGRKNPLSWPVIPEPRPIIDDDFRWHYMMFNDSDRNLITKRIRKSFFGVFEYYRSLPIPIPLPDDDPSRTLGDNCITGKADGPSSRISFC